MKNQVIRQCPHCNTTLNFTKSQKEQLLKALAGVKIGGSASLTCSHCNKLITIKKTGKNQRIDAFGLFPDLMSDLTPEKQRPKKNKHRPHARSTHKKPNAVQSTSSAPPPPPEPPDVSWLKTGKYNEEAQAQDVPSALLLMPDGDDKAAIAEAFRELGYLVAIADSPLEAMEKIRFVKFAAIVQHTHFEGPPLTHSTFHSHMNRLPISTRRYIYYILVGPQFRTLYNLEALASSANLVVNDKDIKYLKYILRRGFQDFENLLGPLFTTLRDHGKQ